MKAGPERSRTRNQRVSNPRQRRSQHLLDVKVRSHKATRYRNKRILVVASKILLAVLLLGGIVFGVRFGARRLFFENPDYRLTQIEVRTDGTLLREQVLQTAELREGENIFRVNLARVRDRLQQLPQVDEVQVVRNLPNEIDIQITERKPVAWITTDKELADPFTSEASFLVDARGALMREKKLLPEYLGLPVITGCANESLEPGKTIESFEAKAALELLRLSAGSFMQSRFQVREIDVSKGYCLVVTAANRARVTFGFDNLEDQLRRLEQFLIWSDENHREIETLNLLVQRNVPVTFAKSPVEVINDTISPEGEEPKILRATPVDPSIKIDPPPPAKSRTSAPDRKIRKALPVERGRKN